MRMGLKHSRWQRWLRWGRVLVLGIVLGGVQLLLALAAERADDWSPFVALSAFFYLAIPALAGFFTARRSGDTYSGVGAGLLVAGIGLLAVAIPVVVGSVLALTAPAPQHICPP